ncbi:MAG: ATP-binding cassette domain-containing protein [Alloprevotella sp.]
MLQIQHISFSYGKRSREVFHDFSLTFQPGHIYGLLGKNGTGKSTLLYLICGLLRPTAGCVTFDGSDVKARRPEVLRDIFLVPEEFELPKVTMDTYVKLNAPFYPNFDAEILRRCLEEFELPADVVLGSLSMGQKKKAFMSFALATRTRLVIMDEPTNGLDIPSKSIFRKIVAQHITDEQTVIISTHQVRDVEMLLDHVVMIDGSLVLLNRSMAEVSAAVRCEQRSMGEPVDDALYVQPSIAGNVVLVPNENPDDETPVNLELLFCCAETGRLPESLK